MVLKVADEMLLNLRTLRSRDADYEYVYRTRQRSLNLPGLSEVNVSAGSAVDFGELFDVVIKALKPLYRANVIQYATASS